MSHSRTFEAPLVRATRVLVVDDDPGSRMLFQLTLERAGFAVSAAVDGFSGLATVAAVDPDVVLLDWMLPDISGAEVCHRLTRSEASARAGVVMVSSRRAEWDLELGFAAGADGFVTKPVNEPRLLDAIDRALWRRAGGW